MSIHLVYSLKLNKKGGRYIVYNVTEFVKRGLLQTSNFSNTGRHSLACGPAIALNLEDYIVATTLGDVVTKFEFITHNELHLFKVENWIHVYERPLFSNLVTYIKEMLVNYKEIANVAMDKQKLSYSNKPD